MTDPTTIDPLEPDDDYEPSLSSGMHYAKGTTPTLDIRTYGARGVAVPAVGVVGWRRGGLTVQAEDPDVLRMIGQKFILAAIELEATIAGHTDQES